MSAASLVGPDFFAFVVDDVESAATFWTDVVGLRPAAHSPPGTHVFETKPIAFALRKPRPGESVGGGAGVALWFSVAGDIDEFREELLHRGADPGDVGDGPFGRMFALRSPGGFTVTVHAAQQ